MGESPRLKQHMFVNSEWKSIDVVIWGSLTTKHIGISVVDNQRGRKWRAWPISMVVQAGLQDAD